MFKAPEHELVGEGFQAPAHELIQQPQGLLNRIKSTVGKYVSPALSIPGATGGPLSLPAKGYDVINQLAGKAGERVATGLASRGANPAPFGAPSRPTGPFNPKLAAAIGTGVAMTPDIVSSVATPIEEVPIAPKTAIGFARRGLGASKRFLNNPFTRGQAAKAAAEALSQDVIPATGSPEVMLSRSQSLEGQVGSEMGKMRKSVGPQTIDEIKQNLEDLRLSETKGNRGGVWNEIHDRIDQALKSLQGIEDKVKGPPPPKSPLLNLVNERGEPFKFPSKPEIPTKIELDEVERLKKEISDSVNWLNDNATQSLTKKIVSKIEKGVTDILGKEGVDLNRYKILKSKYSSVKNMQKYLNNEIAAQQGNQGISLPSMVMGAGKRGPQALLDMIVTEAVKRRGAGIAARNLYKARIPLGAMNPLTRAYQDQNQ